MLQMRILSVRYVETKLRRARREEARSRHYSHRFKRHSRHFSKGTKATTRLVESDVKPVVGGSGKVHHYRHMGH